MLKIHKITPLAITFAAIVMVAAPHASAGTEQNSEYKIGYALAELETPKSAETVLLRIHQTANDVCWQELGPQRHTEKLKVQNCLRDVTQDFVDQIGNKNLSLTHRRAPALKKLQMKTRESQFALAKRGKR